MAETADALFRYLPMRISRAVHYLPREILESLNEIRLRKDAPVSATWGRRNIVFDENGRLCRIESAIRAREDELKECLARLTDSSLYACDEFLAQGFIPLAEGGRAGVCGRAILRNGKMQGFSEISSVNLRLHRHVPDFARPLIDEYRKNGLKGALVCAPPALGKTTFLRSAAFLLSAGKGIPPKRVGIADERCEIAAGAEKAGLADIISGLPKAEAITMLTRTMAPEIIICDEISPSETEAVAEARSTGVELIASAHCQSPRDLLKRGRMKLLLESGAFPLCVILGYDRGYTCTLEKTEELL